MAGDSGSVAPVASMIIPAHDEERSILRTLRAATSGAHGRLEIIVVPNGCTDETAERATGFGDPVRVVSIDDASKQLALRAGDAAASVFPRIYVDADVEIEGPSLLLLVAALERDGVEATAPRRKLALAGASWVVRSYYAVWERLPQVEDGLFGRGVIALTREGHARVLTQPSLMSDDLAMSEAFSPTERQVTSAATVIIRPPRTVRDLLRRRIRVVTGNGQADRTGVRNAEARTSVPTLVRLTKAEPALAPRVLVFLAVTVVARLGARRALRRNDFSTWLRDESSRA